MDNKLIENLRTERINLIRRIAKIDDLLNEYGAAHEVASSKVDISFQSSALDFKDSNGILEGVSLENLSQQIVPKKVLYVLRYIGKGTAKDVADKLIKLVPSHKKSRALPDCRHWLSKYNRSGEIKSEAFGNKNVYSWK